MRSKLFVPGSRPALFAKALAGAADAISIDLEDAVADDRKDEARANVAAFLRSPEALASNKLIIVRVNALGSAHIAADIAAVAVAGLGMLNLPKAESAEDVVACAALLRAAEAANGVSRPIPILANIETARGMRHAAEIARADARVAGLQLGLADLFEESGIARFDKSNVHAALFQLRLAAAEAGVFAFDGAFPDIADSAGYLDEARMSKELGYWGKSCIHPSQVALANRAYGADPAELEQAQRILAAAAVAQQAGQAAFTVDGKMIDPPFVRRAAAVVAAAALPSSDAVDGAVESAADTTALPLAGVRVLDLSAYIAGPYGCTILADMGADVIKIEPPGGDNLRNYPSTLEAASRAFLGVNRSKRGIAIDLKQPDGLAVLLTLVDQADVLVHNFRPGVAERLGIGYDKLCQRRPGLVYCAVTGYGEDGPMKDQPGYDQVLQTFTGICDLQGAEEPEIVYGSVVDYYAASMVASGVSAALYARAGNGTGGGRGRYVGVSLLRSALAMQSARLVWAASEPLDIGRDMRSGGITGLHPTRDGHIYLSANTAHFWATLCDRIGLPGLAADPRYATVKLRAQHADELVPQLRTALAARSALEWEAVFGTDVPNAAARAIDTMFSHPQVLAENMIATMHHPVVGDYLGFAEAVRFGDAPPPFPFAAPAFGQHSAELLAQHGYSPEEIARLREIGVIL